MVFADDLLDDVKYRYMTGAFGNAAICLAPPMQTRFYTYSVFDFDARCSNTDQQSLATKERRCFLGAGSQPVWKVQVGQNPSNKKVDEIVAEFSKVWPLNEEHTQVFLNTSLLTRKKMPNFRPLCANFVRAKFLTESRLKFVKLILYKLVKLIKLTFDDI